MMEVIRAMLESYPAQPPLWVQTELSTARVPSYSLSQRSQKPLWQDVRGEAASTGEFVLQMRGMAAGESDRRGARDFLQALGRWMEDWESRGPQQDSQGETLLALRAGLPVLQEAYDDGTAAWSMTLEADWLSGN